MIAVDLFAGCGGLTLGLKRAGFDVSVGVEIEKRSVSTYMANHPEGKIIQEDIRKIESGQLFEILGNRKPTLVAGCAPCQGFTSLTSKYHRSDSRNSLLLDMARIIDGLRPDAVFMENVPGLVLRGEEIFKKFINNLRKLGYYPNYSIVQMADHGIPQNRRRLVLTAGKGFVIPLPKQTRSCPIRS